MSSGAGTMTLLQMSREKSVESAGFWGQSEKMAGQAVLEVLLQETGPLVPLLCDVKFRELRKLYQAAQRERQHIDGAVAR